MALGRTSDLRVSSINSNIDITKLEHFVKAQDEGQVVEKLIEEEPTEDDEIPTTQEETIPESNEEESKTEDLTQKPNAQLQKEIKQYLNDQNKFTKKFLVEFTKTSVFNHWLFNHSPMIAQLSPFYHIQNQGQLFFENGDYYKGDLLYGQRQSQGQFYHDATNSTYTGSWHQNKRHGDGQLCVEGDKYIYDGAWVNDKREGVGMEICKDQGKYTGSWVNDKRQGAGVQVLPNGDIYNGNFHLGLKHGKGML